MGAALYSRRERCGAATRAARQSFNVLPSFAPREDRGLSARDVPLAGHFCWLLPHSIRFRLGASVTAGIGGAPVNPSQFIR